MSSRWLVGDTGTLASIVRIGQVLTNLRTEVFPDGTQQTDLKKCAPVDECIAGDFTVVPGERATSGNWRHANSRQSRARASRDAYSAQAQMRGTCVAAHPAASRDLSCSEKKAAQASCEVTLPAADHGLPVQRGAWTPSRQSCCCTQMSQNMHRSLASELGFT